MRNASDIFCLKEPKAGENDGSLIFSVSGSSSVKINRKKHPTSDVFPFGGRPPLPEEEPQVAETISDESLPVETPAPEQISPEKTVAVAPATSSMRRNPLTGDGMEDDVKKFSRLGRRRGRYGDQWLW